MNNNDEEQYICIINGEGQYSLWLQWKDIPLGWTHTGFGGAKEDCLSYVKQHWIDMRPKSLQEIMKKQS